MCLYVDRAASRKFRRESPEMVTVWKMGVLSQLGVIWAPFQGDLIKKNEWYSCDRKVWNKVLHTLCMESTIHRGIHVYLSEKAAQYELNYHYHNANVVLRCRALKSDFLGCNRYGHEAAFTKIFVGGEHGRCYRIG